MSTVASDQEVSSHYITGRKRGVHSVLILCESYERLAEFDFAAERVQTLAQDCLRARLRYHPKVRIRHALCRQLEWSEGARTQREGAEVGPDLRVKRAGGENRVDDS